MEKCKAGDKFGLLTVTQTWTEKINRKSKETVCKCACDCGEEIVTLAMYLKNGHKKSCGCLKNKMTNKSHPLWTGHGCISGQFWSTAKRSASKRKIAFEITIEEAWRLFQKQKGKCAISGVEITFAPKAIQNKASEKNTASLDRIDSNIPYKTGNIQWVHKDVNMMKNCLKEDQFIKWCKLICDHQISHLN